MKKSLLRCSLLATLISTSAFAADTGRVLHCGISAANEEPTNEVLTHFAVPGYEVGQVLVEGADYSLKASYLNGELDLELTEKATHTKISSESYGGIPAGAMPKIRLSNNGAPSVIGFCTLR